MSLDRKDLKTSGAFIHSYFIFVNITKCWNTLLIFCTDFPQIYNVDESTLVAEIQSHSADFGQSDFYRKCFVY